MTVRVTFEHDLSLDAVEALWRELEPQTQSSFFLSWTWIGCWLRLSGVSPSLLIARRGSALVGLALFVRPPGHRGRMHLSTAGDVGFDSPFIEYNGFLIAAKDAEAISAAMLGALAQAPLLDISNNGWRRLSLPGVDAALRAQVAAAGLPVASDATRPAPWIDLTRFRDGSAYLAGRSRNTRHQIRQSLSRFEATGPLRVEPAGSMTAAIAGLNELERLHQASWQARGKPGAFAIPFFGAFHRALIAEAWTTGQIDLLRILTEDGRTIGCLYNFVHRGWVYCYQSGFDYGGEDTRNRPGLVCHALAIGHYISAGIERYLLLAGEARYKTSLATDTDWLHWLELRRPRALTWASRWAAKLADRSPSF